MSNPIKTSEHAILYRERIYYPADKEEKDMFLMEPAKYTKGAETIPLDVLIKPKVCVLGLTKCGKSTLAEFICKETGAIHIQIGEIIEDVVERDCVQGQKIR